MSNKKVFNLFNFKKKISFDEYFTVSEIKKQITISIFYNTI
ncbi:hypothetical protein SAMN05421692_0791 [Chryseobacterium indologenes]|nr:hypothetical protein SAMN05421692_0791 [Chryseobacterium indologenes]SUX50007.1 Uncharacterised protein [Chryseobacterium indologenes]